MADRSTRSAKQRIPIPHTGNKPSQSPPPPHHNTRMTRSRSREISDGDGRRLGIRLGRRNAVPVPPHEEESLAASSAQNNHGGRRGARPKALQGLPAVPEAPSVFYPHLPPNGTREGDSRVGTNRRGQRQESQEINPPGESSAISGTTARSSFSAQDLAHSNSREELRKGAMKNAAVANSKLYTSATELPIVEPRNNASSALAGILGGQAHLKDLVPKVAGSRISKIAFNSPKNLPAAVEHLRQRAVMEEAAKALQTQARQEGKGTGKAEGIAMVETSRSKLRPSGIARELVAQVSDPIEAQTVLSAGYEGDDTWRPQTFEEDENEVLTVSKGGATLDRVARARQVLEFQASRDAENNKENILRHVDKPARKLKNLHFTDPQPNAQRIHFESPEPTQSASNNQAGRQRPETAFVEDGDTTEEMGEVSADEGFQQDQRPIGVHQTRSPLPSRKRPVSGPAQSNRPAKTLRRAPRDDTPNDDIRNAVARHNQDESPAPSQLDNYKNANTQAKFMTSIQAKKPQIRKAWTDEETEALIELIEELGTSWKLLKERDDREKSILHSRDQVALKDKARNMKFDFLKAGNYMPQNFENVPLNKFQTDKLRSLGIDYNVRSGTRDED